MYKQIYPILFLITTCFLSGCSIITTKHSNKIRVNEQQPGYYGQWLYIKTNGTNVLPDVSKYDWMPSNLKRSTSNALLNVSEIGPDNIGGRTRAVLIDKTNANRIIAGGVSGGIFITNDKGLSWTAMNDQQLSPSVTGIDQNPFLPSIIYYCTGEGTGNSADIVGAGVFKSTDGGNTFTQLAATNNSNFKVCWSIKCSPKDTNILYVTTGSNGVWKSIDAGNTFFKVYTTGSEVNDLEILPNGSVLIAVKSGGVYRSTSGNPGTFSNISSIGSVSTTRSELSFCKNYPNIVYAAVTNASSGGNESLQKFYKSSDSGKTFSVKSNPNGIVSFYYTWYCLTMAVKDNDSNAIFIGSVSSGYSNDGGNSWIAANDMHADHHVAMNMPNNELLVGCDGGICIYDWSNFSSYTSLNNGLNISQFYSGAISPHANNIMGGFQDNGTNESINNNNTFFNVYGADGGYAFYHNAQSNIKYVSTQNGATYRLTGGNTTTISNNLPAGATSDQKWFIHPYDVSTFNSDYIIYPSGSNSYFSADKGTSFKKLTKITAGRLFASCISAHANPAIYLGGQNCFIVFDSILNAVPAYTNLYGNMPLAIRGSFLNCIKIIPGTRDKAFLAFSNISDSGRLFYATNLLSIKPKYRNISGNIPKGLPVNWVECDPRNPEKTIFAGTDFGLYVSEDSGSTWIKDTRIPNVVVSSIKVSVNQKEIYFFTHGRGVFKGLINNDVILNTNHIAKPGVTFSLYPVPASDYFSIKVLPKDIGSVYNIFNTRGQLQLSGIIEKEITEMRTENLSSGNYIINILNKGLSEHRLFTVLK